MIVVLMWYAVATGLNPFRGEFYAYTDKKGNLSIVDGYKALTRWAQDECAYDVQYRPEEPGPGELYRIKCIIMRDDRREKLDYYLDKGAEFKTAFDLVTTSAVGVVMEDETRWPNGDPKNPPTGWTWEQRAETRALKNALNRSHGMPTVAELARKSWEVAGIMTKPGDWEGTEDLRTAEERERLAEMQARNRGHKEEWDAMTPEEQQAKFQENQRIFYGDEDDDPFGDVIDVEPVEVKEQSDVEKERDMPLGQALGVVLLKPAPKLGLEVGDELLLVVQKDAKDLIEYLTKSSSYSAFTKENKILQDAATVIFENWDDAREVVMRNVRKEEQEEIEEAVVETEGDTPPLF
jgi:hypothetical protein